MKRGTRETASECSEKSGNLHGSSKGVTSKTGTTG